MSINRDEFVNFLEDYLEETEAKELQIKITGEEEQDAPMIDSMQKANYFLKLVKRIDEDIEQIETLCKEEIDKNIERINSYKESQITPLVNKKNYFLKMLRNYTEHELINSKKRSVKLPNGTLSMSKQKPVWTYDDEVIISWLKDNFDREFISEKVEEKIDKVAFKQAVEFENGTPIFKGQQVPGLVVTEREDKFTVK